MKYDLHMMDFWLHVLECAQRGTGRYSTANLRAAKAYAYDYAYACGYLEA